MKTESCDDSVKTEGGDDHAAIAKKPAMTADPKSAKRALDGSFPGLTWGIDLAKAMTKTTSLKNYSSNQYHNSRKYARSQGYTDEDAKGFGRQTSQRTSKLWYGLGGFPHGLAP